MKILVGLGIGCLLAGCGSIHTRTLEYCDVDSDTFIGIPYSSETDCISVSNSGSGDAIDIPVPES